MSGLQEKRKKAKLKSAERSARSQSAAASSTGATSRPAKTAIGYAPRSLHRPAAVRDPALTSSIRRSRRTCRARSRSGDASSFSRAAGAARTKLHDGVSEKIRQQFLFPQQCGLQRQWLQRLYSLKVDGGAVFLHFKTPTEVLKDVSVGATNRSSSQR